MERLTVPDVRVDEHTTRRSIIDGNAVREHAMEIYWRLKDYEDTGLTPEEVSALIKDWSDICTTVGECGGIDRLRELAEADKDGRVVVLPCQSGGLTMADYIRRETAVSAILAEPTDAHYPEWYAQILMKLPAAEVAPVVRCKCCKHSTLPSELTQRYGKPGTLTCHNMHVPSNRRNVGGDDFCSYGERKDGGVNEHVF